MGGPPRRSPRQHIAANLELRGGRGESRHHRYRYHSGGPPLLEKPSTRLPPAPRSDATVQSMSLAGGGNAERAAAQMLQCQTWRGGSGAGGAFSHDIPPPPPAGHILAAQRSAGGESAALLCHGWGRHWWRGGPLRGAAVGWRRDPREEMGTWTEEGGMLHTHLLPQWRYPTEGRVRPEAARPPRCVGCRECVCRL